VFRIKFKIGSLIAKEVEMGNLAEKTIKLPTPER
jgi:hypothetical protein